MSVPSIVVDEQPVFSRSVIRPYRAKSCPLFESSLAKEEMSHRRTKYPAVCRRH
jgi:hypothetical protein